MSHWMRRRCINSCSSPQIAAASQHKVLTFLLEKLNANHVLLVLSRLEVDIVSIPGRVGQPDTWCLTPGASILRCERENKRCRLIFIISRKVSGWKKKNVTAGSLVETSFKAVRNSGSKMGALSSLLGIVGLDSTISYLQTTVVVCGLMFRLFLNVYTTSSPIQVSWTSQFA